MTIYQDGRDMSQLIATSITCSNVTEECARVQTVRLTTLELAGKEDIDKLVDERRSRIA